MVRALSVIFGARSRTWSAGDGVALPHLSHPYVTITTVSGKAFPVVDVTAWEPIDLETSGGNEGHWRRDPRGDDWYFKPRTEHGDRAEGEDWAEKIGAEYAALLGVPAAAVELAQLGSQRGSISRSVRPRDHELQHGELRIGALVDGYVRRSGDRFGHNLNNIRQVLAPFRPPPPLPDTWSAFDAFAGYLLLDALTEQKRQRHIDDGTMKQFCLKATAKKFERSTDGRLTLVHVARKALSLASEAAQTHWAARISGIDLDRYAIVVNGVPDLSDVTRTFVHEMTRINVERLRHEL